MRPLRVGSLMVALSLLLLSASCNRSATPEAIAPTETAPTEAAASSEPAQSDTTQSQLEDFAAATFADSTTVDNQWMPLKPGSHYVYEGTTIEDDGTVVPHRVEINVTDLTKLIGGVSTVATWDLDYGDGELVEAELAFYAQDSEGNVWRMGEYPEEYDAGKVIASPTWIHGFADAQAGIHMKANPEVGTPSYSQGWGPAVDWTDRGQVDQVGQKVCVPMGCYENVLVIAETSLAEAAVDAYQLKSYAPEVGNIHVGWRGEGDKSKEVLELTEFRQLSAEELAEVRTKALELEASAYALSKDVYANTPPLVYNGQPMSAPAKAEAAAPETAMTNGDTAEIVVYTSAIPAAGISELEVWDDPASPDGKMLGLPNYGDELDAPPENDPNVIFPVSVEEGIVYRCWIHMKVGAPVGRSTANLLWVQFSEAVDAADNDVYAIETSSFMTVQGTASEGWEWVECTAPEGAADSLIRFGTTGEVNVRIQAGMEGVGFDQFVLSSAKFLEQAPTEDVLAQ